MSEFSRLRRRRRSRLRESCGFCIALSALLGLGIIMACLMGFAFVLSKINAPTLLISVLATVSLGVGGYFGGYICARKRRKSGMLLGVICGSIIFMVVLIIGAVCAKAALGIGAGGKLLLTMLCGAVGGVVGVNTKSRRF